MQMMNVRVVEGRTPPDDPNTGRLIPAGRMSRIRKYGHSMRLVNQGVLVIVPDDKPRPVAPASAAPVAESKSVKSTKPDKA